MNDYGLPLDVYFGEVTDAKPAWKDLPTTQDEDQDEDPVITPAERKRIESILGFDPVEANERNAVSGVNIKEAFNRAFNSPFG